MGFSLLVIRGLQRLQVAFSTSDAEDYYYLWRVYALAMGIHPRGSPDSTEFLPANLTEADEFYQSYARRHYRPAAENPEGVELTRASLLMLEHMVEHTPLRWLGIGVVPRVYMQQLLGADGLVQRGITPVRHHALTRWTLFTLLKLGTRITARGDRDGLRQFHERLSEEFFQGLINRSFQGGVTFLIPERMADLHAMADKVIRPHGERRRAERRTQPSSAVSAERRHAGRDRRLAFRQGFWGYGGR